MRWVGCCPEARDFPPLGILIHHIQRRKDKINAKDIGKEAVFPFSWDREVFGPLYGLGNVDILSMFRGDYGVVLFFSSPYGHRALSYVSVL